MAAADTPTREVPDWLHASSAWVVGPSWLLSGVVHLTIAFIVWQIAQSPGCQARRGEQVVEGREVGIVVSDPGASPPTQGTAAAAAAIASSETQTPAVPAVPLALPPSEPLAVIGMGPPEFARRAAQAAAGPLVRDSAAGGRGDLGAGPGNRAGTGIGEGTSMYGIPAKGKKFVYVIDRSSSMTDVLVQAKSELMASLRRLDESQAFQVVFFNDAPSELRHRFAMFHGTEADRQLVEDQLAGVSASGGTNRHRALKEALKFQPDVIYFLTDADDPMTAAQREEIRQRLKGAQINCVEFGIGPAVKDQDGRPLTNFLHKLAQESGGGHIYIDINSGANR
jgi:hypothetical protein